MYNVQRSTLIHPSIDDSNIDIIQSGINNKTEYAGLFLCSWQKNKNYLLIPEILDEFRKNELKFKIIFTAPLDNSVEHLEFTKLVEQYNVKNMKMRIVVKMKIILMEYVLGIHQKIFLNNY